MKPAGREMAGAGGLLVTGVVVVVEPDPAVVVVVEPDPAVVVVVEPDLTVVVVVAALVVVV